MKRNDSRFFVDYREIDFMVESAVRSRRHSLSAIVGFIGLDRTVAWPEGARSSIVSGRLRRLRASGRVARDGRKWVMPTC